MLIIYSIYVITLLSLGFLIYFFYKKDFISYKSLQTISLLIFLMIILPFMIISLAFFYKLTSSFLINCFKVFADEDKNSEKKSFFQKLLSFFKIFKKENLFEKYEQEQLINFDKNKTMVDSEEVEENQVLSLEYLRNIVRNKKKFEKQKNQSFYEKVKDYFFGMYSFFFKKEKEKEKEKYQKSNNCDINQYKKYYDQKAYSILKEISVEKADFVNSQITNNLFTTCQRDIMSIIHKLDYCGKQAQEANAHLKNLLKIAYSAYRNVNQRADDSMLDLTAKACINQLVACLSNDYIEIIESTEAHLDKMNDQYEKFFNLRESLIQMIINIENDREAAANNPNFDALAKIENYKKETQIQKNLIEERIKLFLTSNSLMSSDVRHLLILADQNKTDDLKTAVKFVKVSQSKNYTRREKHMFYVKFLEEQISVVTNRANNVLLRTVWTPEQIEQEYKRQFSRVGTLTEIYNINRDFVIGTSTFDKSKIEELEREERLENQARLKGQARLSRAKLKSQAKPKSQTELENGKEEIE